MKTVKLTVMKITTYEDLRAKYENPITQPCDMEVGQVYISINAEKPQGFCQSAWETVKPYVVELANGGGNFFDGWMKDPYSAMVSCNDGFRPVSYYLEVI